MESNVLLFITVPAVGLVATQWAVINWSQAQFAREGITDNKYTYRCVLASNLYHVDLLFRVVQMSLLLLRLVLPLMRGRTHISNWSSTSLDFALAILISCVFTIDPGCSARWPSPF